MEGKRSCVRQIYMIISCNTYLGVPPKKCSHLALEINHNHFECPGLSLYRLTLILQFSIMCTELQYWLALKFCRRDPMAVTDMASRVCEGLNNPLTAVCGTQQPSDCSIWNSTTLWLQYVGLNNPLTAVCGAQQPTTVFPLLPDVYCLAELNKIN